MSSQIQVKDSVPIYVIVSSLPLDVFRFIQVEIPEIRDDQSISVCIVRQGVGLASARGTYYISL